MTRRSWTRMMSCASFADVGAGISRGAIASAWRLFMMRTASVEMPDGEPSRER